MTLDKKTADNIPYRQIVRETCSCGYIGAVYVQSVIDYSKCVTRSTVSSLRVPRNEFEEGGVEFLRAFVDRKNNQSSEKAANNSVSGVSKLNERCESASDTHTLPWYPGVKCNKDTQNQPKYVRDCLFGFSSESQIGVPVLITWALSTMGGTFHHFSPFFTV
ncbi:MAG: hypothetical protein PHY54_17035 [Methylococcales bacterium]|nr:hypothetical protein [Methylococcales bacterium]